MTEPNGWHHSEPVYIQARDGDLALVQYPYRQPISARWREGRREVRGKPVAPWAWVPLEDVIYNWEVRELAKWLVTE